MGGGASVWTGCVCVHTNTYVGHLEDQCEALGRSSAAFFLPPDPSRWVGSSRARRRRRRRRLARVPAARGGGGAGGGVCGSMYLTGGAGADRRCSFAGAQAPARQVNNNVMRRRRRQAPGTLPGRPVLRAGRPGNPRAMPGDAHPAQPQLVSECAPGPRREGRREEADANECSAKGASAAELIQRPRPRGRGRALGKDLSSQLPKRRHWAPNPTLQAFITRLCRRLFGGVPRYAYPSSPRAPPRRRWASGRSSGAQPRRRPARRT